MPCQVAPDCDNLVKEFLDALVTNDQHVWKIDCEKRWARAGSIIVYQ